MRCIDTITDLTWADDKILWVSETSFGKNVQMYDRTRPTSDVKIVDHIMEATSLAYDWLGQKLYWSNPKHNEVGSLKKGKK